MSRVLRYPSEADLPLGVRLASRGTSEICERLPSKRIPRKATTDSCARGVVRVSGRMNRTEAAYAEHLALRQRAGEVLWFAFEAVKLRLAEKTFYTPDFAVMLADRTLEQHEVKGFWEDDARVKIKVAAALYPFRFLAVQKRKDGWKIEEFTRERESP